MTNWAKLFKKFEKSVFIRQQIGVFGSRWTEARASRYDAGSVALLLASPLTFEDNRTMEALLLVLRWSHILGAVLLVGGLAFMRFALIPALNDIDEEHRNRLHESVRRRWLPFVIIGITLLLASGLTNFLLFNSTVKAEGWAEGQWMRQTNYHAIFGVKFLIALAIFYLASGLIGRGTGTAWLRRDRSRWLGVTLGLAVAVIMLSGWLRNLHTGPATTATEPQGVRLEQSSQTAVDAEDRYEDSEAGSAFRAEGDEDAAESAGLAEPAASGEPPAEG